MLFCLALGFCVPAFSQGRKLPNISFKVNSTDFADANRKYNDDNQFTDTLRDEHIIKALAGILDKNPQLLIELAGHVDMNEDTVLGTKRANMVRDMLFMEGVEQERMRVVNLAHEEPIISDELVESLPSQIEKNAANQKNRRVQVKVVGVSEEEEETPAE